MLQLLGIAAMVAGGFALELSPGVGLSLILVGATVYCAGGAADMRALVEPLARELGLEPGFAFMIGGFGRVVMRGSRGGRTVELTASRTRDDGDESCCLEGAVTIDNPRSVRMAILPRLGGWDMYLELLPPVLEGGMLEVEGCEFRGAPEDAARAALARVPPAAFGALEDRASGGDAIRLSGDQCRFHLRRKTALPKADRVAALMDLCVELGRALA